MAELLVELFSEEIPARMQARAADDFAFDYLIGFGNRSGGVNLYAVEVKATGAPVGDYPHGFAFTGGRVVDVTLERLVDPDPATRTAMGDGELQAGLRTQ